MVQNQRGGAYSSGVGAEGLEQVSEILEALGSAATETPENTTES